MFTSMSWGHFKVKEKKKGTKNIRVSKQAAAVIPINSVSFPGI